MSFLGGPISEQKRADFSATFFGFYWEVTVNRVDKYQEGVDDSPVSMTDKDNCGL
jgi:hypothetical protein